MKKRIWLGAALAAVIPGCLGLALAGAGESREETARDKSVLRVTILDSGDYYHSDAGIENGISLALKEIKEELGITVELDIVDDGEDYAKGISLAKALAGDEEVDVALSFQNFESIGATAEIFEEAEKPLVVTMGCYDEVADAGYAYFLADFLSGKAIGNRIGTWLAEKGVKSIALCHSDTKFEKDEIRGLQAALEEEEGISVKDSVTGPFDEESLSALLVRCRKLGVDAVVANFYDRYDSAWLIRRLREKAPGLTVVGDYALDSTEILQEYGTGLEGAVIVPVYPYVKSDKLTAFVTKYEKESGQMFSTAAVQYYDLFRMLAECYKKTGDVKAVFMSALKSEDGYEGAAGTLRFDESGRLLAGECPVAVCRGGEFVFEEE